jgi:hypothetical protein
MTTKQKEDLYKGPTLMTTTLHWPVHGLSFVLPPKALPDARKAAIIELRWILTCFQCAIHEHYQEDSVRRPECDAKINEFLKQAWKTGQLDSTEFYELANGLTLGGGLAIIKAIEGEE